MRVIALMAMVMLVAASHQATTGSEPAQMQPEPQASRDAGAIRFTVWAPTPRALPPKRKAQVGLYVPITRATVRLVSPSAGIVQLGLTDSSGSVVVSKATLKDAGDGVIVFCADSLECAAIPIEPNLLEFDERRVSMAWQSLW